MLTSFSEGQPLVILEAYACGLPVIATDVGACREMIEGRTEEDRGIGPSGIVTRVATPQETAAALVRLARDVRAAAAHGRGGAAAGHGLLPARRHAGLVRATRGSRRARYAAPATTSERGRVIEDELLGRVVRVRTEGSSGLMAGIGWKLQRMIDRGSLAGTIGAYLTGVAVTSAPWLLTTAVLTSLRLAARHAGEDFASSSGSSPSSTR